MRSVTASTSPVMSAGIPSDTPLMWLGDPKNGECGLWRCGLYGARVPVLCSVGAGNGANHGSWAGAGIYGLRSVRGPNRVSRGCGSGGPCVVVILLFVPIWTLELCMRTPFVSTAVDAALLLRFRLWCFRFFLSALRTARAQRLESRFLMQGFVASTLRSLLIYNA